MSSYDRFQGGGRGGGRGRRGARPRGTGPQRGGGTQRHLSAESETNANISGTRPLVGNTSDSGAVARGAGFESRGPNFSNPDNTCPMKSQTLQQLKNDVEHNGLSGLALVQKMTLNGSFYAKMKQSDPTMVERTNILYVLAEVTEIRFTNCRSLILDLFKQIMQITFLEDAAKFFRRTTDKSLNGASVTMPTGLQKDLIYLMKILIDLMDKFPTNSDKYDSAISEVKCALREVEEKRDLIGRFGHMDELLELWEKFKTSWDTVLKMSTDRSAGKKVGKTEWKDQKSDLGPPPEKFQDLDIFPTKRDILEIQKPYLRKNIVAGAYEDSQHYLDVQFRLLREDYIYPLRKGIEAFRSGPAAKNPDIRIYSGITLEPPTVDRKTGEMAYKVRLSEKQFKGIRWERSKRLMYGALVCFSHDGFQDNLIFATVFNRDAEILKHGAIEVYFERPETINYSKTYVMVESDAYFEAYRHVLDGLKAISASKMPFEKYLVKCNSSVGAPAYLRHQNMVDLSPLVKEEFRLSVMDYKRNVFVRERWPQNDITGLDESQFEAMFQALTNEMAIVQGPPGTGKTFIGWQIAKVLLDKHNMKLWNPDNDHPILVVCYTNHALDQFLEGILSFLEDGIIRVGVRSQSEKLSRFVLNNVRKDGNKGITGELSYAIRKARYEQREMEDKMNFQAACWNYLKNPYKELGSREVMKPEIIRFCMENGLPELVAKRLAYLSGNTSIDAAYDFFLTNVQRQPDLLNRDIPEIMRWPLMADIEKFLELGYSEQIVLQAFTAVESTKFVDALGWLTGETVNVPVPTIGTGPAEAEGQKTVEEGENGDNQDASGGNPDENQEGTTENQDELEAEELETALGVMDRGVEDDFEDVEDLFEGMGARDLVSGSGNSERVLQQAKRSFFLKLSSAVRKRQAPVGADSDWETVGSKEEDTHADRIKKQILASKPMPEAAAERIDDVWALQLPDRWRLFRFWVKKVVQSLDEQLRETTHDYGQKTKKLREIKAMGDIEILKKAKVLGMTTTGAAKYQGALQAIQPRIVIMEEAAEVLEAHLVTSLSAGCQHVILIGDHKQLRPNPSVYVLAKHYNLDISLFERLIKNNFQFSQLRLQHRMRPEISGTLMPHFYAELQDHESVNKFPDIQGVQKNVFFLNHGHPEAHEQDSKSHKNKLEAEWAVALCNYLLQQEYRPDQITILVAYSGQFFETRNILRDKIKFKDAKVRVQVVDNYQGEESDIIILSLVRSNNDQKIGFLCVENRVCVALSRARMGFYVLGNFDHLKSAGREKYKIDLWEKIVKSLEERDFIGDSMPIHCEMHGNQQVIRTPGEFFTKSSEGGCQQPCSIRMDCGHTCEKQCHAYDIKHREIKCLRNCGKEMPCGVHFCKKLCYKECGNCMEIVEKHLPCGHNMDVECYKDEMLVECAAPCEKVLACGHNCKARCSQEHTTNCAEMVEKILPCGHIVKGKCCQPAKEILCQTKVMKKWPGCGHTNEAVCSTDVNSKECSTPCGKILKDCEHTCKGTCGECKGGRLHVRCKEPCKNVLICGHECQSVCSKGCPPCSKPCETACMHNQCGKARNYKGKKVGRKCGEPCPFCMENCEGMCEHRQCDKKCHQPCDLSRCMEPCQKELNCKHNKELTKKMTEQKAEIEIQKKRVDAECEKLEKTEKEKESEGEPCPKLQKMVDELAEMSLQWENNRTEFHRCVGVCGEPCIKICRLCDAEEFEKLKNPEIFLGHEDEEDAIFIQLTDCSNKCVLEVRDVDYWVDEMVGNKTEGHEIVVITCPRCKTPIRRSRRYGQVLKQQFLDIQRAKKMIVGNREELIRKRRQLAGILAAMSPFERQEETGFGRRGGVGFGEGFGGGRGGGFGGRGEFNQERPQQPEMGGAFMKVLKALEAEVKRPQDQDLTSQTLARLENLIGFLKMIRDLETRLDDFLTDLVVSFGMSIVSEATYVSPPVLRSVLRRWMRAGHNQTMSFRQTLKWEMNWLVNWIESQKKEASQLMMEQFVGELSRVSLLMSVYRFFQELIVRNQDLTEEDNVLVTEIMTTLNGVEEIGSEQERRVNAFLKKLYEQTRGLGITETERASIVRAIGMSKGHWYKCPNDHIYVIGECGGPMQQTNCPECQAVIGGTSHRLAEGNRLAAEMDEATAPAWPQ